MLSNGLIWMLSNGLIWMLCINIHMASFEWCASTFKLLNLNAVYQFGGKIQNAASMVSMTSINSYVTRVIGRRFNPFLESTFGPVGKGRKSPTVSMACMHRLASKPARDMHFGSDSLSGNANWRGRLSTIDLLIKVACFGTKINHIFNIKMRWSELVSTRRSTVLSHPFQ